MQPCGPSSFCGLAATPFALILIHVILGAQGATRRWNLWGWKGSSGLVATGPLLEQLLFELAIQAKKLFGSKSPTTTRQITQLNSSPLFLVTHQSRPLSMIPLVLLPPKKARASVDFTSFSSQTARQFDLSSPACARFASIIANELLLLSPSLIAMSSQISPPALRAMIPPVTKVATLSAWTVMIAT